MTANLTGTSSEKTKANDKQIQIKKCECNTIFEAGRANTSLEEEEERGESQGRREGLHLAALSPHML